MERKIGEVFTYNGKTYQVVESIVCARCAFRGKLCGLIEPSIGGCMTSNRSDKTSVIFKEINNMEIKNNQLTIDIPEGHIIDVEHSDLSKGIIKFKKSDITYKDIGDALNLEKDLTGVACNINNVTKLSAIDKLINIANYYNKGWKPDWNAPYTRKYFIVYSNAGTYAVDYMYNYAYSTVYFKNREDAIAVINNPDFKDILDVIYKE